MIARAAAIAAGLWLMAAPALLGHAGSLAGSSDRVVGPVAAAVSFIALWGIARALRWVTLPLGLWCILMPWVLGFPTDAALSDLAAGLVFVSTALVRGGVEERYGGGWMSLRKRWPGVEHPPARGPRLRGARPPGS